MSVVAPRRYVRTLTAFAAAGLACGGALASPFATRVLAFDPAPGQFVLNAAYNDPARALGPPPSGSAPTVPDNTKVVSLGGFGGTITLGFDKPIWANRFNPFAADFIVYGNPTFVAGDTLRLFAECGVIEVSRDDNANGLADDAWYLIRGSHLNTPLARTTTTYDASTLNPLWIPPGRSGTWSVAAYQLTSSALRGPVITNTDPDGFEQVFGYADLMPTAVLGDFDGDDIADDPANLPPPERFYTVPDDPMVIGLTPGSGGGASISIAWAVDAATGTPANLDRIDFVRITTGVNAINPPFGEVSTEISAVADVRPKYATDWNQDGATNIDDIFIYLNAWFAGVGENGGGDFDDSGATTIDDIFIFLNAWFGSP